jgi:hypothetical protein
MARRDWRFRPALEKIDIAASLDSVSRETGPTSLKRYSGIVHARPADPAPGDFGSAR